jgi:predicted PurR-regulated permease PerM
VAPDASAARAPRTPGVVAARIVGAGALAVATLLVLRPFLVPLLWAAILAYVTWPLYHRAALRTRRRELTAAGFASGVAIGLGIPVALILVNLAREITQIAGELIAWQQAGAPLPAWLTESEYARRALELARSSDFLKPERAGEWLARGGNAVAGSIVSLASGLARNLFKFTVMLIGLYAFYASGERLVELGRRLAPLLFPVAPAHFVESVGESVRAVMIGLTGTALAQGVLAGVGMAVAGVPSPFVLGTATALVAVLPGGSTTISLLAALWIGWQGHVGAAIGLAIWAVVVVGSMDNFLRPLLISGRVPISFIVVFLGILGGLSAFGVIGIFLGPVLLSVAFTLLNEFSRSGEARGV